jgi:hypothetical protein
MNINPPPSNGSLNITLETLIALLIFAMSIPAAIFQIAVPERLKGISFFTKDLYRWGSRFLIIIMTIIILVLIEGVNSALRFTTYFDIDKLTVVITIGLIISLVIGVIVSTSQITVRTAEIDLRRAYSLYLWIDHQLLVTFPYSKRLRLGNSQEKLQMKLSVWKEAKLRGLISLGEVANRGTEKSYVMKAMRQLSEKVQLEPNYSGRELKDFIQGIEKLLIGGAQDGDQDNFEEAADILNHILAKLKKLSLDHGDDASQALNSLFNLGIEAIKFNSARAGLKIIQTIASVSTGENSMHRDASEHLFKLGVASLTQYQQKLISLSALNHLEYIVSELTSLHNEPGADFLGLVSFYWVQGGSSGEYAIEVLHRAEGNRDQSIIESIDWAVKHYRRKAQFEVSDNLTKLRDQI